jgi:hypothetical protein
MDEYFIVDDYALNHEIFTVANTNGIFKICSPSRFVFQDGNVFK